MALTSAFAPAMVARGRGAILNVASTAALQPLPYSAGYSAAKAYVLAFSEALHQELRGRGVTVTALCPGPVETDFWEIADWQVASGQSFERAVPRPALITAEQAATRRGRRARVRQPRGRAGPADARRDAGCALHPARGQAAGDRVDHARALTRGGV